MPITQRPDLRGTRELLRAIAERLDELGESAVSLEGWRVRMDVVADTEEFLSHEVDLREATLALCQANLASERKRLREATMTLAERDAQVADMAYQLAGRDSDIRDLRERLAVTEARVVELGPYEVSAKYQLMGLRRTLPAATVRRLRRRPKEGTT